MYYLYLSFLIFIQSVTLFASAHPPETLQEYDTIVSTYSKIQANWSYPTHDEELSTKSPFWHVESVSVTTLQGGKEVSKSVSTLSLNLPKVHQYEYEVPGHRLSLLNICEALDDLMMSQNKLECLLAEKMVQIAQIRHLMKNDDMFNLYASTLYVSLKDKREFFMLMPQQFLLRRDSDAPVGSFFNITNVPEYLTHKPAGFAQGHNVFRLAEDAYIGFDPIFFGDGPKSLSEIERLLFEEFVKPDDVTQKREEHAKKVMLYGQKRDLFTTLRRHHQTKQSIYHIIDPAKIQTFLETTEVDTY